MACHRYEGFDREADEISSVNQQIRQYTQQKAEWKRQSGFDEQKADNPRTTDAEAKRLLAESNDLKVRASGLDAKIEQLDMRSRSLVREVKKVGPSLKEAARQAEEGMDSGVAEGSAPMARRHQDADLPAGRWRDPRHLGIHLAERREGRICRRRSRATRRAGRRRSKPAAAWRAIRWAKARPSRAAPSPPT